jgi:hypothetical protein
VNSPYLDQPLLPLAVALPRMLKKLRWSSRPPDQAEARWLRQRADLILDLLSPKGQSPIPT